MARPPLFARYAAVEAAPHDDRTAPTMRGRIDSEKLSVSDLVDSITNVSYSQVAG